MKFRELAEYFLRIEGTSLRNKKTELLAEVLKKVGDEELAPVSYMSVGRLGPLYDPIEFNLAEKMVIRAVSFAYDRQVDEVTREFKKLGDLGDLVGSQDDKYQDEGLLVSEVFEELRKIAEDEGQGSQERKIRKLGGLLRSLDLVSAKYVTRMVAGKLRLGFSDVTVLDALSMMKTGDKRDRKVLEHGFNVRADLAEVAAVYRNKGIKGVEKMDVEPGVPIRPAKAERLGTLSEIVEKLGEMSVEPKYDGMRLQIHAYRGSKKDDTKNQEGLFGEKRDGVVVRIFSRGMEDISHMFPDIVEASRKIVERSGMDFILDSEAIGVDPKTGDFLPFQETVKRKRKHGVGRLAKEVPLKVFVFDLLYLGKKGLLGETYKKRRELLEELVGGGGMIVVAESRVVSDEATAEKYFRRYMAENLEGMMCKRRDSVYQAGARNFNWVKYKRAHEKDLVDTLDCVVMGYYVGKGKRMNFGLGAFLVGVRKGDSYVTVAKIGTGLTDNQWKKMWEKVQEHKTNEKSDSYGVVKILIPDGWVEPMIVVEIEADEITKSPSHTAGYALRFPRLLRFRDDKLVGDVMELGEVEKMYRMQGRGKGL